jgi:hypothetical protein
VIVPRSSTMSNSGIEGLGNAGFLSPGSTCRAVMTDSNDCISLRCCCGVGRDDWGGDLSEGESKDTPGPNGYAMIAGLRLGLGVGVGVSESCDLGFSRGRSRLLEDKLTEHGEDGAESCMTSPNVSPMRSRGSSAVVIVIGAGATVVDNLGISAEVTLCEWPREVAVFKGCWGRAVVPAARFSGIDRERRSLRAGPDADADGACAGAGGWPEETGATLLAPAAGATVVLLLLLPAPCRNMGGCRKVCTLSREGRLDRGWDEPEDG